MGSLGLNSHRCPMPKWPAGVPTHPHPNGEPKTRPDVVVCMGPDTAAQGAGKGGRARKAQDARPKCLLLAPCLPSAQEVMAGVWLCCPHWGQRHGPPQSPSWTGQALSLPSAGDPPRDT